MKVLGSEKRPIKMWLDNIEDGALNQARNIANLPMLFKHVAIMPDAHQGYGMPIGGVAALDGYISPNMVGVDIGCGMIAVETDLQADDLEFDILKKIVGDIRQVVPVGFAHHDSVQDDMLMPTDHDLDSLLIVGRQYDSALKQIGTLGGGNHFIEIQKSTDGMIWVMIHSGSRNIGFKVANHYNKIAVALNEKYYSQVPKAHELAYLPLDSDEGHAYRDEMQYCIDFALANRQLMLHLVLDVMQSHIKFNTSGSINIAHNYAAMENHYGKNVMVHRKGATRAREDELGIIPGSQGTSSYIVTGKGSPESFNSCSHGAGRAMGRKQAKRTLDIKSEQKRMEGILHSVRNEQDLDEAPGAYKDIHTVMNSQSDLVNILVELSPLAVVKG